MNSLGYKELLVGTNPNDSTLGSDRYGVVLRYFRKADTLLGGLSLEIITRS